MKSGNSSSSASSPSMSPVAVRKTQRKSKKQRQENQMDTLRKMVGCSDAVTDLELLEKVMEYINRLRDVLDENNEDNAERPAEITGVHSMFHRLSISPLKDANAHSASRA
uniref:BHLH domain-containing protein n=1 Tax=Panagrellus redivivus TaxID=6233 RepID=A0A7E5A0K8_PANRE